MMFDFAQAETEIPRTYTSHVFLPYNGMALVTILSSSYHYIAGVSGRHMCDVFLPHPLFMCD